jgi:hypothetical protein
LGKPRDFLAKTSGLLFQAHVAVLLLAESAWA